MAGQASASTGTGTKGEQQHRESKEERLSEIAAVLRHVGGTSRYTYPAIYSAGTGTGTDTDTDTDTDMGIREEEQHNGIKEERLSEIAVLLLRVGSAVGAIPRRHPRVS